MAAVVTGVRELDRVLNALPETIGRKVVKQAVTKTAAPLRKMMRQAAPRDEGHLKRNIVTEPAKKGEKVKTTYIASVGPSKKDYIYPTKFYPREGKVRDTRARDIAYGFEYGWPGSPPGVKKYKGWMRRVKMAYEGPHVRVFQLAVAGKLDAEAARLAKKMGAGKALNVKEAAAVGVLGGN